MDQLAADLNNALNDANILTSSLNNVPMASSSSSIVTASKIKRRRKRPINIDTQQQKTEASDSTTPENSRNRNINNPSMASDGDDVLMPSKTQSSSFVVASESDCASQSDDIRRRRRPFKKPVIPLITKNEPNKQFTRCPSMKTSNCTMNTHVLNRRHNNRRIDLDDDPLAHSTSSPSLSLAVSNMNCNGKRKRSRAIIHDDFRLRNNSLHDYDMTSVDDSNMTNISSSSSLNLSDSDRDLCLTSNEADDEQSDWPKDESSVPHGMPWKNDRHYNKIDDDNDATGGDDDDDDDDDEKMLTTSAGTLEKIVNGAFSMLVTNSKKAIHDRFETIVNREMLTGTRRNLSSKNIYTHPHLKRHVRLFKETRRSHHHSYSHKRVKNEHYPQKHQDNVISIESANINDQLLEKVGWTPDHASSLNQNATNRHFRQGLGYENNSMDISERMENEQISSSTSHPSHV